MCPHRNSVELGHMWMLFSKCKKLFGWAFLSVQESLDLFSHQRNLAQGSRHKNNIPRSL